MKKIKYTIPTIIAASLAFTSCGDDNAEVAKEETTQKEAATAQKIGTHAAVKAALKTQINSVTADAMLKVPSFIDLPPAEYSMPDSLAGRDLVQVSVKWPMIAKEDLYSLDRILHDLPTKPSVINKEYSKGDQVDYIESNYVLAADGGGGYVLQNSRFVKQNFEFPDVEAKSTLGKSLLVKGSDEHMAAVKEAASIKQAADDKKRMAKAEAEVEKLAGYKAKEDQLLAVLQKDGQLKGLSGRVGRTTTTQVILFNPQVSQVAGKTKVTLQIKQISSRTGKVGDPATFEGLFEEGVLILRITKTGDTNHSNYGADYIRDESSIQLYTTDNVDHLKAQAQSGSYKYVLDLFRS